MKVKFLMIVALALGSLTNLRADQINGTNNTSINIPDNDPIFGASSGIYISPTDPDVTLNSYVVDLNLAFTIAGTGSGAWAGDYTLTLKHIGEDNSSQSLTLFSSLPYGNNGFDQVTVTSAAGSLNNTSADYSTTPISGTYGGVDLSVFQNISPTGEWVLSVTDNSGMNQGILTGWTLSLDVVPEPSNVTLIIGGGLMGSVILARTGRIQNRLRKNQFPV